MKIIPIFFYHEKWVVIMRKFVYSPDGGREDGSPSWGRKFFWLPLSLQFSIGREDGSPSWGRKLYSLASSKVIGRGREDGSPSWGRE